MYSQCSQPTQNVHWWTHWQFGEGVSERRQYVNNDNYKASFILATYTVSCIHTYTGVSQRIENSPRVTQTPLSTWFCFPLCVSGGEKKKHTIKPPNLHTVQDYVNTGNGKKVLLNNMNASQYSRMVLGRRVCSYNSLEFPFGSNKKA